MTLPTLLSCLYAIHLVTLVSAIPIQQPIPVNRRPRLRVQALTFRIAIFSDLHFGEDENSFGIAQDENSTALMDFILQLEQPDLAILNGDLITGDNTFASNSSKYIDQIVEPLIRQGVPWASTYGNHDTKFNLSREDMLQEEQKYPLSLTQHGPEDTHGVTNYRLEIYPPDWWPSIATKPSDVQTEVEKPLAFLHFFDSRGGSVNRTDNVDNIPNWVSEETATWFRRSTREALDTWGYAADQPPIPSFAFVHIPMRAFLDLQNSVSANVSGAHYPGLNADVPLAQQGNGSESEPFMRALLDTPGLHSIYSGHDHGDSWCGRWLDDSVPMDVSSGDAAPEVEGQGDPIARQTTTKHIASANTTCTEAKASDNDDSTATRPFLCFCKHSGFGGYGTWNRGVRILELQFNYLGGMHVHTWVRMQDGRKITAVNLNETYGFDEYPTDDGGFHPYEL